MVDSNNLGATELQQQHSYNCTGSISYNEAPEKHGAMADLGTPKGHPCGNSARSEKWIIGSCDGIQKTHGLYTMSKLNRSYLIIFRSADANVSTISETVLKSRDSNALHSGYTRT